MCDKICTYLIFIGYSGPDKRLRANSFGFHCRLSFSYLRPRVSPVSVERAVHLCLFSSAIFFYLYLQIRFAKMKLNYLPLSKWTMTD